MMPILPFKGPIQGTGTHTSPSNHIGTGASPGTNDSPLRQRQQRPSIAVTSLPTPSSTLSSSSSSSSSSSFCSLPPSPSTTTTAAAATPFPPASTSMPASASASSTSVQVTTTSRPSSPPTTPTSRRSKTITHSLNTSTTSFSGSGSNNTIGVSTSSNGVPAFVSGAFGGIIASLPPLSSYTLDISLEDVHVYVPPQVIAARTAGRKERGALEASTGSGGGGENKPAHGLRERPSFMSLNKILPSSSSQATVGPWRRSTLRLSEQPSEERASTTYLLQIQEENYTTHIHIQDLACTDIRAIHPTLFHLNNCLGIYNTTSSSATTSPDTPLEPVYLHFPSRTTLSTWLALFRSCVRPETYGVQLAPRAQGGLYRTWRAIDLTLIEGRNISSSGSSSSSAAEKDRARKEVSGTLKWYGRMGYGGGANPAHTFGTGIGNTYSTAVTGASTSGPTQDRGTGKGKDKHASLNSTSVNEEKELSPSEDDIFCTIYVSGELAARSSIQGAPPKSENVLMPPLSAENTPIWNESFEFDYLPPFNDTPQSERSENNILRILVYRIPRKSNLERFVQGAMRNVTPPTSHFGSTLEPQGQSQQSSASTSSLQILSGSLSPSAPAFDLSASGSNSSTAQNQILIGKVDIPLSSFKQGEAIESHWPIVPEPIPQLRRSHSGIVLGELRLKIRVDEEYILPQERYTALHEAFKNRNSVLFGAEIEERIQPKLPGFTPSELQRNVFWMNAGRGVCMRDMCDALSVDIAASAKKAGTLLRETSPATYWAQRAFAFLGQDFINASVGPVIQQLVDRNIYFETRRTNVSDKVSDKELGSGVKECVKWCDEMWTNIYNRRDECPQEIRQVLAHVRNQVDQQYAGRKDLKKLRLQGVVAMIFLRLIVPAILDPRKYFVIHGTPNPLVSRSLQQIAKIIQALANMCTPTAKALYSEDYQRPIFEFLNSNLDAMSDYILVVSTPKPPAWKSEVLDPQEQAAQEHIAALRQLETNLPALHRESISDSYSGLDVSRCLACIASTVARSSAASPHVTSKLSARSSTTKARDRDRDVETTAAKIDAVISASYDVERDLAKAIARVKARSESHARSRSTSSPYIPNLSPQFQPLALTPTLFHVTPPRPPLTSLQFVAPRMASLNIRRGSRDHGVPRSPIAPEGERPLSTMLEVPANPLEPYQRSNAIPPSGVPSFPPQASPEPNPPDSPTVADKQRTKLIAKSPSRGELNRSATRKRSGLLRMLPGRRDG